MARRIPLPRLTRRQRLARWQQERRQQAVYVTLFSAVLFFVVGLAAWAASDRFYQENLKPALRFDGKATAMRDYQAELKYQLTRFFVEYGVPAGYENDPQIAEQKAGYERSALDALVEFNVLDREAAANSITIDRGSIDARFAEDFGQFSSRHILIAINKDAEDKAVEEANALAKATAIRDELRQDPNNQDLWNRVAKESSQDPGSADSGGELGFVGKGQFVKEFEQAAQALAIGQVSDPVKTDFGYHVIQVKERRGPDDSELVKRWSAVGISADFIKAHTRYDLLREEFTRRRQEQGTTSPTAQIRVAQIQVAAPRPVGGDLQRFSEQLKKVGDISTALEKGTDFAEVAKEFSEDSATKDNGGDMGWIARGMLTDLSAENDLFALEVGKVSEQHNTLVTTTWYKVLERSESRDLDDDQKTKIKDSAYQYWLNQQKRAHDVVRLIPGLEFDQ